MTSAEKSSHTAGPWTIRDYKTKDGGIWIDGGFKRNRSCGTVALVYPLSDQEANAALISAAIDLKAALAALLPEIDAEIEQRQTSGNDEYWEGLKALSDAGHAALALSESR